MYIFENAHALGVDREKMVITGDSAGGQLTLSTAMATGKRGIRERSATNLLKI